jgi:D-lactate dehydrogenase (cytochrome)
VTDGPVSAFLEATGALLGQEGILTSADDVALLSNDIFFWGERCDPAAVLRPGSTAELAGLMGLANDAAIPVYVRGGGMSYTGGYVPSVPDSVVIDLSRLNRVVEINEDNRTVVVDACCTWETLVDALKPHGLATIVSPPFSGNVSTIGGAMSQNLVQGMDGVLGLEVVLADGRVVRTGAWGRGESSPPFFRNYGPDITGIFLGDTGSLGIKTRVALQLRNKPEGISFGSFAFETYEDMARAMSGCARYPFLAKSFGLDPLKSQRAPKVGFKEAIQTLSQIGQEGGAREAARFAATGRNFMEGVKWSMHVTTEGIDGRAAEAGMDLVRATNADCGGREIPNLLPAAMSVRNFSVRGFLGPEGERWVPTNGIFPLSRAPAVATAVQQFFADRRERLQDHGMIESYMTSFGSNYFLCEPSVYWKDEVSPLHLRHLDSASARKFARHAPGEDARDTAVAVRGELRDLFHELGAVNVQVAKFYRYRDALDGPAWSLVEDLKGTLDPKGILSPGNLGLG